MRTALEYYGGMPSRAHFIVCEVAHFVNSLPDAPRDIQKDGLWSCHAIARAVHRVFNLEEHGWKVVDGYFVNNVRHSWLYHESVSNRFVLDTYPVASLGKPILVSVEPLSPWHKLYIPMSSRYQGPFLTEIENEAAAICRMYTQ